MNSIRIGSYYTQNPRANKHEWSKRELRKAINKTMRVWAIAIVAGVVIGAGIGIMV